MPCGAIDLQDKIAVVTGGGSGINLAFSKLAVQQGAKVLIADLRLTDEGRIFVDNAASSSSPTVVFVKCDVRKRADLENLITVSRDTFGSVPDVYIAGAGVFEPSWSNWWDDTEDDGYAQIEVNVNHALKLARIATRALLSENKRGTIQIVASIAGYAGTFSAPLYCASKHAVIGFVRSMAELDTLSNIKVTAVAPGVVDTPLWTDNPEKMKQFAYNPATAVSPKAVAEAMLDLVTNGQYKGGACLEVSLAGTRSLGTWNLEPPQSTGTSLPQSAIDLSQAPLIAIMDRERGRSRNQ